MSLNQLVRLPLSSNGRTRREDYLIRHSLCRTHKPYQQKLKLPMVVEAKSKKGMAARQFQRQAPPPLPKLDDDGNPKFVIFIRMANKKFKFYILIHRSPYPYYLKSLSLSLFCCIYLKLVTFPDVYLWYPLNIVTGGTTAKIMVAAKDNFLGKYIYKDTLPRNLAAVIYKDEKEMQKMAMKQFRVLRSATEFKYGYKLVENNNLRAALAANDVIELPSQEELKTVLDKVKDFLGDAKESFGKMTFLNSEAKTSEDDTEEKTKEKSRAKS